MEWMNGMRSFMCYQYFIPYVTLIMMSSDLLYAIRINCFPEMYYKLLPHLQTFRRPSWIGKINNSHYKIYRKSVVFAYRSPAYI